MNCVELEDSLILYTASSSELVFIDRARFGTVRCRHRMCRSQTLLDMCYDWTREVACELSRDAGRHDRQVISDNF